MVNTRKTRLKHRKRRTQRLRLRLHQRGGLPQPHHSTVAELLPPAKSPEEIAQNTTNIINAIHDTLYGARTDQQLTAMLNKYNNDPKLSQYMKHSRIINVINNRHAVFDKQKTQEEADY